MKVSRRSRGELRLSTALVAPTEGEAETTMVCDWEDGGENHRQDHQPLIRQQFR
jgi:hypothetical protein